MNLIRILLLTFLMEAMTQGQPVTAAASQASFDREVRPLLKQYCLGCHSTAQHTGDVDLERFTSFKEVLKDARVWQKVLEQLIVGEMPPKQMPQPGLDQRAQLIKWVNGALSQAARANAGDPGPVVLRRLNNAEYTFTIQDLTGVKSLEPAKEFPADGAAGEGFMNTGNALAMSPSLVTKYLDAAKGITSHAVLLPGGIRFSPATSRRDWTDQILSDIRKLYQEFTEAGGAETVTQQGIALDKNRGGGLPLKRYLTASLALRGVDGKVAIERVARQQGLSSKYLGALVRLLKGTRPSPLLGDLRARWRTAKPGDVDAMAAEIVRWQNTLWKFSSVGHIGKVDGPKAWMEAVDPVVEQQECRLKLASAAKGNEVTVYLAAHNAGDGQAGDFAVWREPKLVMAGGAQVLLRELPSFVAALQQRRERIFAATAKSLLTAEDSKRAVGEEQKAWVDFLSINSAKEFKLDLLKKKMEKTGAYDFVKGWGSAQFPLILSNSSSQHVRVPGNMKPNGVAVHPSQTLNAAVGWRSPLAGIMHVEGAMTRAHAECGSGVTWFVELRRGGMRRQLAKGDARGATPVAFKLHRVRVQPGDLVTVFVGPRDGNFSCALTDLDMRLTRVDGPERWSLAEDVASDVLAANPHADRSGRGGIWHFYTEPVVSVSGDVVIPEGSLLARWQSAEESADRTQLAEALGRLLTARQLPVKAESPDGVLYRQLASLASPLLSSSMPAASTGSKSPNGETWGLSEAMFGKCPNGGEIAAADICVKAPSVLAVRLPADLAVNSEFVTTGALDKTSGFEGSVQLEVLTSKPQARTGLLKAGTSVGDAKGQWTSNNQVVSFSIPVVVNKGSAARKRVEGAFQEFRQMFPAALCYTKIVPVDEVVTLTLFHREDDHLSLLILDEKQKAKLDVLWDELHYVSRDALTLVDAFEQLWQFATQDADPSKFEPLRKPIQARAAAFERTLLESEPLHVDGVIAFADRAYRRPLTASEKEQLRGFYSQLRKQELPHEDSIRLLLARVMVSPAFLYRTENSAAGKLSAPVGDYELASRLSYFLWSSMPDAELRDAAAAGALRTAAGLQAQSRRMIRDQKVRRLGTEFGAAWLHLHGFDTLDEKSERHFPGFRDLRAPMYEETIRFFMDLFSNNGSVLSLLDADHTFVNEALARHYGINGITGPELRRVDGVRQYSRGGVLGQAAVLSKQAGASRTSPILRGNWILEVLLGEKLPRPPKDVPLLPADEAAETLTMRQLTEKHTSDQRCAGCHSRIDPFGYTLERFDAIGKLREKDLGNRPINDRSTVKDGLELKGLEGLRGYLMTKGRDAFVRQFSRKLLGFSLGRAVQLSDEPLLDSINSRLAASGFHVGLAIDMIVASRQFLEIRGREYEQNQE